MTSPAAPTSAAKRPNQTRANLARVAAAREAEQQAAAVLAPAPAPEAVEPEPVADTRRAKDRRADKSLPAKQRRKQQGVYWDADLVAYAAVAASRLKLTHPDAEISSLADLVDIAVRDKLTELENKYNGGKAFTAVTLH